MKRDWYFNIENILLFFFDDTFGEKEIACLEMGPIIRGLKKLVCQGST